ncbi:TIR domain-containing protein [Frankia umida]|uniref:TIR domain-containing protein n=1 Tax=Frankia umida TaxID=573489 RepID=UPI003558CBB4
MLLQAWNFAAGSNWPTEMQCGVICPARTIVILSHDYPLSQYTAADWQAARKDDPAGEVRKLLVMRGAGCPGRGCPWDGRARQ